MAQVFIAHSSQDAWFVNPIAENLRSINVDPYLAELDAPNPVSLYDKLTGAIQRSTAVFLILTHNVVNRPETRDIVNWEAATAKAYNKPVYVFRERDVEVPILISQILVYFTFDPFDQGSLHEAMTRVVGVASKLKDLEDKGKAAAAMIMLFLGLGFLWDMYSRK